MHRSVGKLKLRSSRAESNRPLRATVHQNSSSVQMASANHVGTAVLVHVARRCRLDSALDERSFKWQSNLRRGFNINHIYYCVFIHDSLTFRILSLARVGRKNEWPRKFCTMNLNVVLPDIDNLPKELSGGIRQNSQSFHGR